jgi:hypothetical protein
MPSSVCKRLLSSSRTLCDSAAGSAPLPGVWSGQESCRAHRKLALHRHIGLPPAAVPMEVTEKRKASFCETLLPGPGTVKFVIASEVRVAK